jgi:hypothetical protein
MSEGFANIMSPFTNFGLSVLNRAAASRVVRRCCEVSTMDDWLRVTAWMDQIATEIDDLETLGIASTTGVPCWN